MNKYLIVYHKEISNKAFNEIVEWDKITAKNIAEFEIPFDDSNRTIINIIKLDE